MISLNWEPINVDHFPDGSLNIKLPKTTTQKDTKKFYLTWTPTNINEETLAIFFVGKQLKNNYPDFSITLKIKCMPYARMDRVEKEEDVFSLKWICELLNSIGFETIFVYDPHSDVTSALLNSVKIITPKREIEDFFDHICSVYKLNKEDFVFCYPDAGATKKYSKIFSQPYVSGIKNRDWETGKIRDMKLETNGLEVKGKNIFIIDDICSKGGTFIGMIKLLKEAGAKNIFLAVSHCEETIYEGNLLSNPNLVDVFIADSQIVIPGTEEIK